MIAVVGAGDEAVVADAARAAVDEVRRAEFFRKGGRMRGLLLFALNRRILKAYLLKESLDRLWTYRYERAMLNYLEKWIDQLRWQRLEPFRKLARLLWHTWTGS